MAWEAGSVSSIEDVSDIRVTGSEEVLDAGASEFEQTTRVERHTVTGESAVAILDEAIRLAVDEVIIGARSLRPFGAALLGSVAYKVLHEANIPVVVVR